MPRKKSAKNTVEPLVVSPREAQTLLGVGRSYLYGLLGKGSLDFYKEGFSTKITRASIDRHIAARLAEGGRTGTCNANRKA
jgi:excisionase family DNA binding protein